VKRVDVAWNTSETGSGLLRVSADLSVIILLTLAL